MSEEATTPVKFHFYSLKFTPLKREERIHNSTSIVKGIVTHLNQERAAGRGHLIDKNKGRQNEGPRELFMTSALFMHKERRVRCSMALLRAGRVPKLKPVDKFKLVPLKEMGTIAEETHFYIDYSKDYNVLCVEFNYYGPRLSDIEYYLRNVARDTLKLSKATDVSIYMDTSIDETLAELQNVLNFEVKMQPQKLAQMDTDLVGKYFTGMTKFRDAINPQFIKLEAMFQSPGKKQITQENKKANNMVKELLGKFKSRPFNIECFDNFVVRYENKEGIEDVFNLLNGKKEIIKEVDLKTIKKKRDWYELIEKDFDEFINTL